ncbi:type II secretion system F family protein [Candidatus Kaiserbacteria bacterium]|nr:type II secretion system F family protein [Candidatus Kaiserbacteria bacterium]
MKLPEFLTTPRHFPWKKKKGAAATEGAAAEPNAPASTPTPETRQIKAKKKPRKQITLFVRFPIKEQVHFAKRLAFLIGAGVSVLESLHLLHDQTKGSSKRYIYSQIITDVNAGTFLSSSLAKFRQFFGAFAINIIKIGETGGVLKENLNYLADELQKKEALRKKVVGALIYPIFITLATLLLSGMLTVFIFPKVMPIFQSLNVTLPLTTIVLLAISNFLSEYGLYLIAGIVLFIILVRVAVRYSPRFRYGVHFTILRLPLFGKLYRQYHMTNFCRTLGLLLKSGINVVEAITITGDTMSNMVYQRQCTLLAESVSHGGRISAYLLKHTNYFPDVTAHLIAIGETTGALSDTLLYLSNMYENEVNDMTKNLSNSIEPILMIFMGLIVGFVAVSVITPIYEVTQHLQR